MLRKLLPLLVIGMWGVGVVYLPKEATATTPLTRADIEKIRNLVQLKPKNRPQRAARSLDAMFPGDGVSTGRASLAELRFNDRSLARVGEQAVFQFLPRTRNFKLSNGTVFILIPPKQGRTRIQTPNAAAAIRGSALFVRYDEQTDTTIIGALTNSGIEVSNKDASQSQVLEAGQMVVIIKDRINKLYEFDLRTFYETSDLVKGLDLARINGVPSADPAIAQVQEETTAAIAAQKPIIGAGVITNPPFLKLTGSSPTSPSATDNNVINNNSPVDTFQEIGEILSNNDKKKDNLSGSTPITTPTKPESPTDPPTTPPKIEPPTEPPDKPPVITPPKPESPSDPPDKPPIITPPKPESPSDPPDKPPDKQPEPESPTDPPDKPPVITPPKPESPSDPPDKPPVITPPKPESPSDPPVKPPVITPPKPESPSDPPVKPPVITPPVITPPVITPPVTPPVITPPVTPPVITPPVITPPVITPPVTPPVITPPVTPPVITPPVITPPVTPPVITPPVITPPVTPPVITPPVITPPVTPPVITPPVTPPVITPPVITPPVITPPVTPPVITPPVTPPVITPPVITPPVTPPIKPST